MGEMAAGRGHELAPGRGLGCGQGERAGKVRERGTTGLQMKLNEKDREGRKDAFLYSSQGAGGAKLTEDRRGCVPSRGAWVPLALSHRSLKMSLLVGRKS